MKTAYLIKTDIKVNNNKFYKSVLNDDGTIDVEFGRVGGTSQKCHYPASRGGERFYNKKIKEKERKGYKPTKTIESEMGGGGESSTKKIQTNELAQIAKSQIKTSGDVILDNLIERLVRENIHAITSNTNITFNVESGLFQTPLGVVTLDGINEARSLLGELTPIVKKKDFNSDEFISAIQDYFMIIPTCFGSGTKRFEAESFFADPSDQLNKQLQILDSLEASYEAVKKGPKPEPNNEKKPEQELEKVFELSLDIASQEDFRRVSDMYFHSRQTMHRSVYNLKPKVLYKVHMPQMADNFNKKGLDNVWELWHGTKECNLLSILKSGLKIDPPSTAHISGKMFHSGAYFTDQSTKALNYATSFWGGKSSKVCYAFIADVAMGNYEVPSGPRSRMPSSGYDSYFAKGNQSGVMNNEMIVFDENAVNLKYLMEFE